MPAIQIATYKPTLSHQVGDRLYLNITDRCTLRCQFYPKHRDDARVHGLAWNARFTCTAPEETCL